MAENLSESVAQFECAVVRVHGAWLHNVLRAMPQMPRLPKLEDFEGVFGNEVARRGAVIDIDKVLGAAAVL